MQIKATGIVSFVIFFLLFVLKVYSVNFSAPMALFFVYAKTSKTDTIFRHKYTVIFVIPQFDLFCACSVEILGDFRFDYEYEIEYENDFSILVCRLHIVASHTYLIP